MGKGVVRVSIKNFTRQNLKVLTGVPFSTVSDAVLPGWEVSLVFVGATKARSLNQSLRSKSYIPNVLSYEVGTKSGEIIICLSEAATESPRFGMNERNFVLLLFIHGLLHLEGRAHGATMEQCEQKLLAKFLPAQASAKGRVRTSPNVSTNRNRNRHRHIPGKTGRG
ncbi:rRNA maturation RNase YbeY [Candidatus Kaiserbacteria bacterium RIFCSPLOWO2_12_FULL_52_8]|uniref:Endoribonuclease YbeY n=1 Tax=Candidatus Kaiserbacteria bacterium RIFCSPHIGHO2_01_FULL_53_31 TaxID=1798481 RepID=A0A1F6CH66_9BACT|nr:MAG: rRNA maturation RNase YbeY [Candidatus Kaiserbacteria bacterium RIFCSPHIGHO2_01_FULL_53_31]OGG93334.1 MAG: rRNA maturation RNase YbeY [Candidatus Kaiserbacteria bacterium RIFCSPLOWO2_12_FULL_52_8]